MKNKRIVDSWNKIEPNAATEARMLDSILARNHSGETEEGKVITMNKVLNWKRLAPIAACLALAVAITIPFLNNSSGDFDLQLSDKGTKVSYVDKVPNINTITSLVYLTEDELLADVYEGYPVVIFSGTITEVKNIRLDFGDGSDNYRAVAKIEVEDVLRGDMEAGETVSVLLPAPVGVEGVQVSDTGISSQMTIGVTGIFTPMKYDETSVRKQNNKEIHLLDLAEYGLPDGERWAFLETVNGLQYDHEAYPSLIGTENLNDVKEFIHSKIK
jgi:hypothetical protein